MRLFELSDTSYSYRKINDPVMSGDKYEFTSSNGLKYIVIFNLYNGFSLEIEFELEKGPKYDRSRIGITGTGDQFRIFSTIKNIVEHYFNSIDLNEINKIMFSADELSRIKLYDKFVPIVLKMLGANWRFEYTDTHGSKLYKFVKS